jgi:hypothetical protein
MEITEKELAEALLEEINYCLSGANISGKGIGSLMRVMKRACPNYYAKFEGDRYNLYTYMPLPESEFVSGFCGNCGDLLFDDNTTDCRCE